jgi:hypothetical protein
VRDQTLAGRPREFQLKGHEEDGVTVSAIDLASGRQRTWVAIAPDFSVLGAIRQAVAELRVLNADGAKWRIASLSTPQSILRDLGGDRRFRGDRTKPVHAETPRPELFFLDRVGALDLLAPFKKQTPRETRRSWRRRREAR